MFQFLSSKTLVSGTDSDYGRIEPVAPAVRMAAINAENERENHSLAEGEKNFPAFDGLLKKLQHLMDEIGLYCEPSRMQGQVIIDLKDSEGRFIRRISAEQAMDMLNDYDGGYLAEA